MRCVGATPIRHGEVIAVKDAARRLGCGFGRDRRQHAAHLKGTSADRGQPRVNTYRHPEKLLRDDGDDDPE
jgi:hypothetical protein